MPLCRPCRWLHLILVLSLVLLAGCTAGLTPPATPGARARLVTHTPTPTAETPALAPAIPDSPAMATISPTAASLGTSPRTIIRTFSDAQGRTITLYHGRGIGRRGDWGWAHILGKHLRGEWADGGPVTTFSVIDVTTPEGVMETINRSLQDPEPNFVASGRREYRVPTPTGRYELLTVVGSDGAIITAYPDPVRRPR